MAHKGMRGAGRDRQEGGKGKEEKKRREKKKKKERRKKVKGKEASYPRFHRFLMIEEITFKII